MAREGIVSSKSRMTALGRSGLSSFRNFESIINFNAKIPYGTLHLGVSEQDVGAERKLTSPHFRGDFWFTNTPCVRRLATSAKKFYSYPWASESQVGGPILRKKKIKGVGVGHWEIQKNCSMRVWNTAYTFWGVPSAQRGVRCGWVKTGSFLAGILRVWGPCTGYRHSVRMPRDIIVPCACPTPPYTCLNRYRSATTKTFAQQKGLRD